MIRRGPAHRRQREAERPTPEVRTRHAGGTFSPLDRNLIAGDLETSILKHNKTMAFIIQFNSELACPRVQCDHCGEIIDEPAIAIAAWDEPFHQEGAVYATRFHHKECDGKVKPPLQRWMQLDEYLARILANLGVTARKLKQVEAKMDRMSGLGP
jgi:hypothetical protein